MVKIKEDRKIPTPAERAEMALLEKEGDRLWDLLSHDPTNRELIDRLNRVEIAYVRLSGEWTMDY